MIATTITTVIRNVGWLHGWWETRDHMDRRDADASAMHANGSSVSATFEDTLTGTHNDENPENKNKR